MRVDSVEELVACADAMAARLSAPRSVEKCIFDRECGVEEAKFVCNECQRR